MAYNNLYLTEQVPFNTLLNQTLTAITVDTEESQIVFTTQEGKTYVLAHDQRCCEEVYIESVVGDTNDLLNTPILVAEETTNETDPPVNTCDGECVSYTWTFYKFATIRGYVDIRWYGTSNGCYSESANLYSM